MKDDKPILLVDNSNTRTKYALSSADGELCAPVRCLPTSQISPQRVRETLAGWSFGQVVLCSVVTTAAAVLSSIFAEWPLHCISHTDCPQLLRLYKNPACVGADRLANAAAVALFYSLPALAVDLGTACTFDAVVDMDQKPTLLGGAIAPGLRAFAEAPARSAQQLPELTDADLEDHVDSPLARDTRSALRAGVLMGYEEMLRGIVRRARAECGGELCTVLTGGDARRGTGAPEWADIVDMQLTLKGMLALAQGKLR